MRDVSWATFKSFVDTKGLRGQYVEDTLNYYLYCFDGGFTLECSLAKDASSDTVDFEDNYKDNFNLPIEIIDSDGATIVNPKLATQGRGYQSLFAWTTIGKYDGMKCRDENNNLTSMFTQKIYNAAGDEITSALDEGTAVKTEIEFKPDRSYDIQGFCVYQKEQPTTNIFVNCISAHHVPAEYGGSRVAIRGCNLRNAPFGAREMDWVGDSTTAVNYDPTYLSHEHLMRIFHDAGVQHNIMIEVIWYV